MIKESQKISSLVVIAWKNVVRKIFRNIILVLAVAMLVSLLVFALLFNRAIKQDIEAASMKLGADIVIVPIDAVEVAEEFILESNEKTFYMDESLYDAVKDLPEVAMATYHVYLNTLESECCSIIEGQVVAIDQETDFVIKPWLDTDRKLQAGEAYIGSYVHEYLGLLDSATLFGRPIKVVGHLEETGTGLDHGFFIRRQDLDNITTEATGQRKEKDISIIFLKLKAGVDLDEVVRKIRSISPNMGLMTRGSIGKDVRTTLGDIIRIFTITILIASTLAILLAWSTFTAMTNERRREVGILQAIGASRKHIITMFMAEAAIISLLGGIIGVIAGHLLLNYLAADFNLLTRLGNVSITSTSSIMLSLLAMTLGAGACLIGAILPVYRLARLEPLLALKEE
jgi:putative ABC transport system permease protein